MSEVTDVIDAEAAKVDDMSKDELAEFALATYGVTIDKRKSIDTIIAELKKMADKKDEPAKADPPAEKPKFLKNIQNGRVYEYQPLIAVLDFMKPCTKAGKLL